MIGKANQQVNPKFAALAILALLIVIQVVWWRGLVMKVTTPGRGGPMRGGGAPPGPPIIVGRKDVSVVTVTGAPEPGDSDGPGYRARFDCPIGIALDRQGNLYVADSLNNRIRRVTPQGETTTVAGSVAGMADGPVAAARFNCPCGVTVAPDGTIYVADTGNDRICRIKDGVVTSIPDAGAAARLTANTAPARGPCALTYVAQPIPGLLVTEAVSHRLRMIDLTGKPVREWSVPGTPLGVYAGKAVVIAAGGAGLVDPSGTVRNEIAIDLQGNEGNQKDFTLRQVVGVCAAPGGLFVADAEQSAVFYVQGKQATVVAGVTRGRLRTADWRDADGEKAKFGRIGGLATDGQGRLYVSDTSNNSIRRLTLPQELAGRLEDQR
jgi:sugar lactone lactonase YvrE